MNKDNMKSISNTSLVFVACVAASLMLHGCVKLFKDVEKTAEDVEKVAEDAAVIETDVVGLL